MKTKFLSLILTAFLCLGAFTFSACDNGYNISNFNTDYESIGNNLNVTINSGYLVFDLSKIEQAVTENGEEENSHLLYLRNYYQPLVRSSLSFVVYAKDVLTASTTVEKDLCNLIDDQLTALNDASKNVGQQIEEFSNIIANTSSEDADRDYRFNLVTRAYNEFFNATRTLSSTMARAYFENVVSNENQNYYEDNTNFALYVQNSLQDLARYQIFNLTQSYIEMHVDGADMISIALTFTNYQSKVDTLNSYIASSTDKSFDKSDEGALHPLAVKLYNLNSKIINERDLYLNACNQIVYTEVATEQSDYNETSAVQIINTYSETIDDFNDVLISIYALL